MEQNLQQPKKWGYTWVIVALCCLMVTIALGFCSSSKSIYITPVCEANGLARSAFSLRINFFSAAPIFAPITQPI